MSLFAYIFGFAKRGDRTLMGRSQSNFGPKLEPIHRTSSAQEDAYLNVLRKMMSPRAHSHFVILCKHFYYITCYLHSGAPLWCLSALSTLPTY